MDLESLFGHNGPPIVTTMQEPAPIVEPELERDAVVMINTTDPWPAEAEPEPKPCGQCGSLELWQTMTGRWRCMKCDPPTRALEALEQVQRIRQRYGMAKGEKFPGTLKKSEASLTA